MFCSVLCSACSYQLQNLIVTCNNLLVILSGQIYKLRSPSRRYLSSLATYDSSNPTKDWGFPELSVDKQFLPNSKSSVNCESETLDGMALSKESSLLRGQTYEKVTYACSIAEFTLVKYYLITSPSKPLKFCPGHKQYHYFHK